MATTAIVYNHDVQGLHRRINRFIVEAINAASNGVSMVSDADQSRMSTYLVAIKTYVAWVVSQPVLDLPETHPREYVLEENPAVPVIENESLLDLIHLFTLARDEMVNGQSGRMASGLIRFDNDRILAIIAKAESFLSDYVAIVTPLDLPESSPMHVLAGQGKKGV